MARLVRPDESPPPSDAVAYWRDRLERRGEFADEFWRDAGGGPAEDGAVPLEVARRRRESRADG